MSNVYDTYFFDYSLLICSGVFLLFARQKIRDNIYTKQEMKEKLPNADSNFKLEMLDESSIFGKEQYSKIKSTQSQYSGKVIATLIT